MFYNNCIDELLALEEFSIMNSSPEGIAKKINKCLLKMGMFEVDKESLEKKVGELSDDAMRAMLAGIKKGDVYKVLNILGLHPTRKGVLA